MHSPDFEMIKLLWRSWDYLHQARDDAHSAWVQIIRRGLGWWGGVIW